MEKENDSAASFEERFEQEFVRKTLNAMSRHIQWLWAIFHLDLKTITLPKVAPDNSPRALNWNASCLFNTLGHTSDTNVSTSSIPDSVNATSKKLHHTLNLMDSKLSRDLSKSERKEEEKRGFGKFRPDIKRMFLNLGSMDGTTDTALTKSNDEFSKVLDSTSTANAYIQVMDYLDNEKISGHVAP